MSGRGRTGVAQDERKPKEKLQKIADKRETERQRRSRYKEEGDKEQKTDLKRGKEEVGREK